MYFQLIHTMLIVTFLATKFMKKPVILLRMFLSLLSFNILLSHFQQRHGHVPQCSPKCLIKSIFSSKNFAQNQQGLHLQSQWSSIVCVSFPLDKRCLVTKFAWMVLPFSWLFMPPLSVIIFQHSKFLKKTYIWTSETLHEVYVWVQFVFSFSTLYYSEIIGRYWPFDSENKTSFVGIFRLTFLATTGNFLFPTRIPSR